MNTPNFKTLKELRMWHWRQVLALRSEANRYDRSEHAHARERGKRMHAVANLHLSAVQVLNDSLPGTAEQDCAEEDNG